MFFELVMNWKFAGSMFVVETLRLVAGKAM